MSASAYPIRVGEEEIGQVAVFTSEVEASPWSYWEWRMPIWRLPPMNLPEANCGIGKPARFFKSNEA